MKTKNEKEKIKERGVYEKIFKENFKYIVYKK